MVPGYVDILLESGILFCCATATTKTTLGIIQLWLNYFRGILAYTLPGSLLSSGNVAALCAFLPSPR